MRINGNNPVNLTMAQSMLNFDVIYAIQVLFFALIFGHSNATKAAEVSSGTAPIAVTYTWQQPVTGDWQSPSSWMPARTEPAFSDILVFNAGGSTTAINVPTQAVGQLLISGNTVVNLQSASAIVLTIAGSDGNDLAVERNSSLNFNSTNAITVNFASGATASINGSMTFSSPSTTGHRLTAVDAGAVIFDVGAVFTAGQGFTGNPFGTTSLNSVIFEAGSTYVCIDGSDPFGAAEPASVVVFKKGSLFSLQGDVIPSFSGRTYGNFEMNYPQGYIFVYGPSAMVMDDLTIEAGILALSLTGTPGHSIRGNITIMPGTRLEFQPTFPGVTINLNGSEPQTITTFGPMAHNDGFTLSIDNPSGITLYGFFGAWNAELINGVVTITYPLGFFKVVGTVFRVNGYVDGNLRRWFDSFGTYVFDVGTENGYSPVTIDATDGHDFPLAMQVKAVQSSQPNLFDPSRALSRYWQVTGSKNITEANLVFNYLDPNDIPTSATESNFVIQRYSNGFTQPAGVIDTQANTFRVTGLTDLSMAAWTLAEPGALGSPTATATPTATNTPTSTPTNTPTNTATATPTTTPTPECTTVVLYDQTSGSGTNGTSSQDFETASDTFDARAADDFVVPAGQTWTIRQVVASGLYFNGAGPADSFNVTFYTDAAALPGSAVAGGTFTGATYTNAAGVFTIMLPSSLVLNSGTYWVSVQVRMDFTPGGQWAWSNRVTQSNSGATWQNPGGGFNIPACIGWARRGATCAIDAAAPDQVFQIVGTTGSGCAPTEFDYDGDHKTDISVFRPADGAWYLQQSTAGLFGILWGFGSDKITPADFDGDGKTDIAVYRPSTGIWYVYNSSNGTVSYHVFGLAEDLPTPADYDGDGKADVSVFRPSTGTWYRQNSSNGSFFGVQFGATEDKPTVGDFDGDGKADIAVFRPSSGAWYRINSLDSSIFGQLFGFGSDVLAPADYDGDGKTDIAVYRPSTGIWYIQNSSNGEVTYNIFGLAADIPAPGDFDGDGKADVCVFRPSDGTWYRQNSSNGAFIAFQFGTNGDIPTQTAFRY